MANLIANPTWGMTDRESSVQIRTDLPEVSHWYFKNRDRLSFSSFSFGTNAIIRWAYALLGYTPVKPDKMGGASRPDVGQLTP